MSAHAGPDAKAAPAHAAGLLADLSAGLAAALHDAGQAAGQVQNLQRLTGGASQQTWAFELQPADGPAQPLILRRAAAAGAPSRGGGPGLAAEAALIQRAALGGVPVPVVQCLLRPAHGLGEGFVMRRLPGETLGRRIASAPRPRLAWQCGQALARIHQLPLSELPPLRCHQPRQALSHLADWHASHRRARPVFEWALRWLAEHAPADVPPALVHGDFRNGNLMVDLATDGGALVGVLDWELAQLGDAMADLGWLGGASWRFGHGERPVGGFGQWAELLGGYRAAGGVIDLGRLRWWQVLGTLRWGVICDGMAQAWLSSAEPVMEKAAIGRRASEAECDLLQLLAPRAESAPTPAASRQAPRRGQEDLGAARRFLESH